MAKSKDIEFSDGSRIPILYEDRSVLAIDKPRGWMLVPTDWQRTRFNLQAALESGIRAGEFWARSRNLKFLRFVHRLDAETSGVMVMVKSLGAVRPFSELFESRSIQKVYLAVVEGIPKTPEWTCKKNIAEDSSGKGKVRIDPAGKDAVTEFKLLQTMDKLSLVEGRPSTGRTHQIRIHLASEGLPIVGDAVYGSKTKLPLGLRAIRLRYLDPFTRKKVEINAPVETFLAEYGFSSFNYGKKL